MITAVINPKINAIVGKFNFGTVRNGIPIFAELMNRITRKQFDFNIQPAIVEFDIKNAFNEVWRSSIRSSCKKHCPEILQFYDFVYNKHSMIYYRDGFRIRSTRGFQQGDGLSTMFSLVTYDAFSKSKSFGDIKFVKFFFDDGRACDELRKMDNILSCIEGCLGTVGLGLNFHKTIIYFKRDNGNYCNFLRSKWKVKIKKRIQLPYVGYFCGKQDFNRRMVTYERNGND